MSAHPRQVTWTLPAATAEALAKLRPASPYQSEEDFALFLLTRSLEAFASAVLKRQLSTRAVLTPDELRALGGTEGPSRNLIS